ncbi:MAG: arginine--tRNA ligase [Chitinophagales bacterium]|nr:arginine--tRNA ligase [Chitinophagales bacterium]
MLPEQNIKQSVVAAIASLYQATINPEQLQITETRREFDGDFTLMVFPLVKISRQSPEQTGQALGEYLQAQHTYIEHFNVIKGFLNLRLSNDFWLDMFRQIVSNPNYGTLPPTGKCIVVEYCSPNTNKPLHLGHVRNMLLGWSVAAILAAAGNEVHKVLIYNDRGIHICKTMAAWLAVGKGDTPESTGKKGDFLVGEYYIKFAELHAQQKQNLIEGGMSADEAEQATPIFKAAQELLRQWEANDPKTRQLWEMMNAWVYPGHNETYAKLGVDFEKRYYESETYLGGKQMVESGLAKGVFYRKENGAVAIDLSAEKLDEKILVRGDGTTIYITQDLAAADMRYNDYQMDTSIYVVGDEQNYHFKVLKAIMQHLGYPFADQIYHLSYGMIDLPTGRMKSREGTVVDADDMIAEVIATAQAHTEALGKTEGFTPEASQNLYRIVGLGALKFHLLKINPQKRIIFNPEESIDFLGHTGPFVQNCHARIQSVVRKYKAEHQLDGTIQLNPTDLHPAERNLFVQLYRYVPALQVAAQTYDPAAIADYAYQLAKLYNHFYAECPILSNKDPQLNHFRTVLSLTVARLLRQSMGLLGIELPDRM